MDGSNNYYLSEKRVKNLSMAARTSVSTEKKQGVTI